MREIFPGATFSRWGRALARGAADNLARWTMADILGLAFLLRLTAIFAFPSLHHPDENFQLLEQAHRLAFGYGIEPWEFQDGIRSLVVPYLLGRVFAWTEPIFGGPQGYIYAVRILLAGLSLIGVAAVYQMGLRTSRTHALLVGLVAATWFEMVYFSFRPLTEALACDFLLVALAMASRPDAELTRRHLLTIGFCLGVSLMLRIHLFAGLLFLALWIGRFDFRGRWLPLALGGLPPLIAFGAADWLAWDSPFRSFVQAIWINLGEAKASSFGVRPDYWFFQSIYYVWAGALPLLLAFIAVRARAAKLWLGVALSIIASHSLISHKEYRFIFPALACLVLVAAMGSADLLERARQRLRPNLAKYLTASGALFWIATSASLAFAPGFSQNWFRSRELIDTSFWLSAQPDLCGLLIYDHPWVRTGGYAYLHRNVPLYARMLDYDLARRSTEAFNFIVLYRSSIADFQPQFGFARCLGDGAPDDICAIKRLGSCRRNPDLRPLLERSRLGER